MALPCFISKAATVIYQKSDSIKVVQLLQKASKLSSDANLPLFFAKQFINLPYVPFTLEGYDPERLIVNLREIDCTTLVENVIALVRTAKQKKISFEMFCRELEKIRYYGGKLNGYESRLHYFSEWIEDNTKKGLVQERGDGEPPFIASQTLDLHYMSTHPQAYTYLKKHPEIVNRIRQNEKRLTGRKVYYIPQEKLHGYTKELQRVKDGDIIAIVTSVNGLDISHVGFAQWKHGHLHLLNASRLRKKVVLEPQTLYHYMKKQRSQIGIRVITLK